MNSIKQFFNLFAILSVTVFLFTGCEKKGFVDSIVEMYDDGIERVDKANSLDDVQNCYNDINKNVEEFKQGHLREMAALDSTITKIEDAKLIFTKACCIKAFSFDHGYIKNTEGVTIGVNDAGEVLPLESIEGDDRLASDYEEGNSSMQNPLGFTGLTPYFNSEYHWKFHISIQNSEGDYLYSDEDAERYYNHYLGLFFIAYQMAKHFDEDKRDYLKSNFTNIVSNLPLNDTFPEDIRECANKIYYDHKDEANTVFINERGYGYVQCAYYENLNRNELRFFNLKRDKKHNGRFVIISGSRYDEL